MFEYGEFVDNLKIELNSYKTTPKKLWSISANRYVNGFAEEELRRLVSLEKRRNDGVFFTDSFLAEKVLEILKPTFNDQSVIYDSSCGACNLLIATSNYFHKHGIQPAKKNYLLGTDIHPEFLAAANLRMLMNNLLLLSGKTKNISKHKKGFSVLNKNGLVSNQFYKTATHIFINPPFDQERLYEKLQWASGKVSMAAVFIEKAILFTKPGTIIMAILPDVLRSGTRYQKWRNMLDKHCIIEKIELLGQFDEFADVDVYAIKLVKRKQPTEKVVINVTENTTQKTLKDIFDICVGPVVDYRDKNEGPLRPYVVSRGLKSWSIEKEICLKRKNTGKSFKGPFVVIKRTSRATDTNRAMATIINTKESVYVDNHLIILKPKSKKLATCKLAIEVLKDKKTNDWLNQKIRCRHLTVKIIRDIPILN